MDTIISQILNVTQNAAIACYWHIWSWDKMAADQAATESMRQTLNTLSISWTIVIGEWERDEAPMLFIGEKVGKWWTEIDISVDPLEGTNLCAYNMPGSITVMWIGPKGSLTNAPDTYMEKLVVGKKVWNKVSLNKTLEENIKIIAQSYKITIPEVHIIIMNRKRHKKLIQDIHNIWAKVKLITDWDIMWGIETLLGETTNIHALMGIGAAPEWVITACAVKTLWGYMESRFKPYDEDMKIKQTNIVERMQKIWIQEEKIYTMNDLAKWDELYFFATWVTTCSLLKWIKKNNEKITTHSIVWNSKNKSRQHITTNHLTHK
jgi:fructose-1,6-bisphosphatase II